jgi:hypothetical protein
MCTVSYQAIIPLRGIRFRDEGLAPDPFVREWTVLSLRQMAAFALRYDSARSVQGNVESIIKRLNPDAFLMVSLETPELADPVGRINRRVDSVLGALCLTALLTPEHKEDRKQYSPRPLFWAKTPENCELPLIVDRSCVKVSGHTGMAWLSPDSTGEAGGKSLGTVTSFVSAIDSAPSSVKAVLGGRKLDGWQEPLAAILGNLHACFLVGSPAQCAANLISFAEVCVTPSKDELWQRRVNRLKILTGCEYWTRVQDVIEARHDYVHRSKQVADTVAFSALALAVQTWCVMHELAERLGSLEIAIKFVENHVGPGFPGKKRTHELTKGERVRVTASCRDIPQGPLRKLYWINHALTDIPWNDYYERFVIFDEAFCKKCARWVELQASKPITSGRQRYRCASCGGGIQVIHPFESNR